jgi:transmembrane sensor
VNTNANDMEDDVLVKYLLGEATAAEQNGVEQWINASAANRKYFEQFRLIWDQSKHLASTSVIDENAAWDRFVQRTKAEAEEKPEARVIPLQSFSWVRAAAILILLAGTALVVYNVAGPGKVQMLTAHAGNTTFTDTLPDGSVIVLNRNSTVTYPSRFTGDSRPVTLKGEAFFSVAPDKSKPFIIEAENASIKVVGTTFNVKSTEQKTEVIVETGIVEVAKNQNTVKVVHNQKAIVSKNSDKPTMENNTDELYNYYRTKEFVCSSTPLWKLAEVLNEAYDVNIVIANGRLREQQLTTTFHEEPIDDILQVVAATFNATIEKRGKEIILR